MLAARWRAILQWVTDHGQPPQYLLTLTLRNVLPLWREAPPAQQAQQKEAAAALTRFLTRALTRLVAETRQHFGPFEYVAFVELTTGRRTPGHRPHLHLLVRGPAIPSTWLSRRWCFHTHGSFRIDFQPVRSAMHAAGYLVGYTEGQRKKEQQIHLTSWPGPRVRYSRGYFPAPANTDGGTIIVGVRENNKLPEAWPGVPRRELTDCWLENRCYAKITPLIPFEYQEIPVEGNLDNALVIIRVGASRLRPHIFAPANDNGPASFFAGPFVIEGGGALLNGKGVEA